MKAEQPSKLDVNDIQEKINNQLFEVLEPVNFLNKHLTTWQADKNNRYKQPNDRNLEQIVFFSEGYDTAEDNSKLNRYFNRLINKDGNTIFSDEQAKYETFVWKRLQWFFEGYVNAKMIYYLKETKIQVEEAGRNFTKHLPTINKGLEFVRTSKNRYKNVKDAVEAYFKKVGKILPPEPKDFLVWYYNKLHSGKPYLKVPKIEIADFEQYHNYVVQQFEDGKPPPDKSELSAIAVAMVIYYLEEAGTIEVRTRTHESIEYNINRFRLPMHNLGSIRTYLIQINTHLDKKNHRLQASNWLKKHKHNSAYDKCNAD